MMITAKIRGDEISAEVMSAGKVVGVAYLTQDRWDDISIWDDWADDRLVEWLDAKNMNEYAEDYLPLAPLMRIILEAVCAAAYDDSGDSAQEWVEQARKSTEIFSIDDIHVAINPERNPYMHLWAETYHPELEFSVMANGCDVRLVTLGEIFDRSKISSLDNVEYSYDSGDHIFARVNGWRPGEVHKETILEVITSSMSWGVWYSTFQYGDAPLQ